MSVEGPFGCHGMIAAPLGPLRDYHYARVQAQGLVQYMLHSRVIMSVIIKS